jgi:two-component system, OmpR family, phosphate regulon response regulator OmpR
MKELKPKILIVDDDIRILHLLKQFFNKNGFEALGAETAEDAMIIMEEEDIDMLILDVMLPRTTGFDFAKQIKEKSKKTPIILLTALSDPEDRIRGLESGADDYITKPFEPKELILRAKNLLELYKANFNNNDSAEDFKFGELSYSFASKSINKAGENIQLSSTDTKLLENFIKNKGKAITREELSSLMGGLSDRSIDVQIVRLRQKIELDPKNPKFLLTVRHEGYGFFA